MHKRYKVAFSYWILNTKDRSFSRLQNCMKIILKEVEKSMVPLSRHLDLSQIRLEKPCSCQHIGRKKPLFSFSLCSLLFENKVTPRGPPVHWTNVNIWLLWVVISENEYCCWQMTGCKFRALTGSLWTPRSRGDLHEHDRLQQGPAAVLLLDCGQAARLHRQRRSGLAIPGAGNLHLVLTGRVWSSVSSIWMRLQLLRFNHIFLQIFEQVISISFYSFR